MSLRIQKVRKDKIFDIGSGAKLHYRFLDPLEQMRFMRNYGRNAKMTEDESMKVSYDLMLEMVTGWEGVINDDTDRPIKFKTELIEMLPMAAIVNFITVIITPLFEGIGKKQEESNLGN